MIRASQIPPEVKAAFLATLQRQGGATMSEALAAGLNAWPRMGYFNYSFPHIILPLPTETRDA